MEYFEDLAIALEDPWELARMVALHKAAGYRIRAVGFVGNWLVVHMVHETRWWVTEGVKGKAIQEILDALRAL